MLLLSFQFNHAIKLQSILKHQFKTTDINKIKQYGPRQGQQCIVFSEESNLGLIHPDIGTSNIDKVGNISYNN